VPIVTSIPKAPELAQLSVADRLDLMDELWASLNQAADKLPVPDWHSAENKRRLAALAVDGRHGRAAEEVIAELKLKL
jgi:putative addiction module component (TIGR02574 family)